MSEACQSTEKKRFIRYLRCKNNIVCLQDIHIQESLVPYVKVEWDFDAYFSTFSNNCRGSMILLNNNLPKKFIYIYL